MSDSAQYAENAANWAGFPLTEDQKELLAGYAYWLEAEAIPAGGLGPREAERIWGRHIADGITFAGGWTTAPTEILDVGTGVGLPGVPLAILWPDTEVTLLDRGGRRIRLLTRVINVLGLENLHIAKGDVFDVADEWDGITFRGSVRAPEAVGLSAKMLTLEGTAVLGLSRQAQPPDRTRDLVAVGEALGLGMEVREIPETVLDGPGWLLIMRSGE